MVDLEDIVEIRASGPARSGSRARWRWWTQVPPQEVESLVHGEPCGEERRAVLLRQRRREDPAYAVAMERCGDVVDLVDREQSDGMGDELTGVFVTVPRRNAQAAPRSAVT